MLMTKKHFLNLPKFGGRENLLSFPFYIGSYKTELSNKQWMKNNLRALKNTDTHFFQNF